MKIPKKMKKKKPIYFEDKFALGLYKAPITFVFGNRQKYSKMMREKYKYYEEESHFSVGSAVEVINRKTGRRKYILWLPKINYGALAHEALHLANYIFDAKGIGVNKESGDEHLAYLVEWLVTEYLRSVKDFRKRKRKKENERKKK